MAKKSKELINVTVLVRSEYLLRVTRVCPVTIDRQETIELLAKEYGEDREVIEDDFDGYLEDFFHEKNDDQKTEIYCKAMNQSDSDLNDISDEMSRIDDVLSESFTGLNNLEVLNSNSFSGDIHIAQVINNEESQVDIPPTLSQLAQGELVRNL
jgi:hypothetical protein